MASLLRSDQDTARLVRAVKNHALEHYETYGWSEVIECYEDSDIIGIIGDATTPAGAIRKVRAVVAIRQERYREAVGPEVTCPACGGKFDENTACASQKCREGW